MKIQKSELKSIIKECVAEVLAENSQLQPYDFDADWNRMDEAGVPVIHLTEEEYKTLIGTGEGDTIINSSEEFESFINEIKKSKNIKL